MREAEIIQWIRQRYAGDPARVPVGPGDDVAVVRPGSERVLVTTDQVLDGVHFVLADVGAEAAGRKAMARNLSDVAAMAGQPVAAVATVAAPEGFQMPDAEALHRGMTGLGDAFGCPLVGGDVAAWPGRLAVSVTVLAIPGAREPVLRSGARPGDALLVTGALGGAWRTDRHLTFTPRIAEARALAGRCSIHAMIDLSDGLSVDLGHVCEASGVGAEVAADAVPIHDDARLADDALAAALNDGEDYELLLAVAPHEAERLLVDPPDGVALWRVGRVVADGGCTLVDAAGTRRPLRPAGWEHRT